jgi:hypothetical protein
MWCRRAGPAGRGGLDVVGYQALQESDAIVALKDNDAPVGQ